jgi:hypothetical protein
MASWMRERMRAVAIIGAAAGLAGLVSCAAPQTKEQAEAQRKQGSAATEPTRVPPPDVQVNPPPPIIRPNPGGSSQTQPGSGRLAAGAPLPPEPPPPVATPDAGEAVGDSFRPTWWIPKPARADGRVTVAAAAEGASLMEARTRVVGAGLAGLRSELGAEEPANTKTLKTGVVRLNSGQYRAFVLMAADAK